MGYGVYRFNETINGLEPLTTHKYENMNLNKVVPIIKDDADNYLIGTTYGVIKYASENSYQLFNAKDGFLNSTIHAILRHSSDNFWLSTNQGLIILIPKEMYSALTALATGLKSSNLVTELPQRPANGYTVFWRNQRLCSYSGRRTSRTALYASHLL